MLCVALAACGDGGAGLNAEAGGAGAACVADGDCASGHVCFRGTCVFQGEGPGGAAPDGGPVEPPEREAEPGAFPAPGAGRHYVWVASPAQDAVVRVHARTLAVARTEVGDEPTIVRTRPGDDTAVVLNRGSDEVTVVRLEGDEEHLEFYPLPHHFNALELHPAGRFAFCWLDLDDVRPGEDASALQDVAVIDLVDRDVHAVAVGFRPRRLVFTADGDRALVVTDDGVSVIELADLRRSHVAATFPVAVDVLAHAGREVLVTPDGRWVASRGPGEPGLTVVDLEEGVPRFVPLDGEPTDVDLLPDGRTVLAMLRAEERAVLVPIDRAADEPESVEVVDLAGRRLGSAAVAPTGEVAVLFTTVEREGEAPRVALLDLASRRVVDRPVRKGVAGVAVDPTGRVAWLLHTKAEGEPDPADGEDAFLARSHAYSLLDLGTAYAKLVTTPAAPSGPVFAADGETALVLLSAPERGVAQAQLLRLRAFDVRTIELGSPPEFGGVLPAVERAFVTQTHPAGRITFLDLTDPEDPAPTTLSGYALNGRIR